MTQDAAATRAMTELARLLSVLLQALHALEFIGRHLNPDGLDAVLDAIGAPDAALRTALADLPAGDAITAETAALRPRILRATEVTLASYDGLRAAMAARDLRGMYRAIRREARALEELFPLTSLVPAVHAFFLEPDARTAVPPGAVASGQPSILHAANDTDARGGFSVIVPDTYHPETAHPLIVALHGGSGHGRNFLWNWVKTARTRGIIVACPTATGQTWALGGPDPDSPNLARVVEFVRTRWNIDASKLALSGMSDGGTFTLLSGLQAGSPFTHLAPFATGFHPMLAEMADPARVRGLPIYLVHGALDWMFPVELAQTAQRMLTHVGAAVTYREIPDLAHVYPRDENARLVDWLLATPA